MLEDTNLRSIPLSTGFGVYSVLTFDDNCNRQSTPFLVTGLTDEKDINSIQIHPNPAESQLYVKGEGIQSLRIVNQVGLNMIVEFEETQEGWSLNVSPLPKGLYIILVQSSFGVTRHRVVVR